MLRVQVTNIKRSPDSNPSLPQPVTRRTYSNLNHPSRHTPGTTTLTRSNESLQETNNKTLGTTAGAFPIVTLPDGRNLPTGTVGALLVNIKSYDEATEEQRAELEPAIQSAIPTLVKIGMFNLFTPQKWASQRSPARSLVGKLAREFLE